MFAKNSMWNATPVNPVLGTTHIPELRELANVEDGPAYGVRSYVATAADGPVDINVDYSETGGVVHLPHWPTAAIPPTGVDGHLEIFDETTGLIHSFWGMQLGPPKHSSKYTCERFDGLGWGTPERPDGPRAAGVTVVSGTLRTWETDLSEVNHALAIVLGDASHIKNGPVFPATSQDVGDGAGFTGPFPYGQFFMLPPTFNYSSFLTETAKKIARTLMKRGAYMIDLGNGGFTICAEYGGTWGDANRWNNTECPDIEKMKRALLPVVSVGGWLDADGVPFVPTPWDKMNILSMRGPWGSDSTDTVQSGHFNTQTARYEYPATTIPMITNAKAIWLRDDKKPDPWHQWWSSCWYTNPTQGASYTVTAIGTGGVTGSLVVWKADWSGQLFGSNALAPGQSQVFTMPTDAGGIIVQIYHTKAAGPAASIRLELVKN
jgi:hypothetical protein